MADVVDREKATVEATSTTVDREKATVEATSTTVDREKATVEATSPTVDREKATVADDLVNHAISKWTIICYIQDVPLDSVLQKHLPKGSQHHQWNSPITFGRGMGVNVFLNDERVSRHHLELTGQLLPNTQVCFSIRNISTTNGVLVNGEEIVKDQMHYVKSGDRITIGCIAFKLEINPGESMENYLLKFVHPQEVCEKHRPVQEVKSSGEEEAQKGILTKQPSENIEDDKPIQDTKQPKDVD